MGFSNGIRILRILLQLKEQGQVIDIELQPKFLLQDKYIYKGKTVRKMEYIADFKVILFRW